MKHLMGIDQFFLLCCLAAFFHVSSCNGAALNKSPYGRAFLTKLAKFRKSLDPAHQDAVHPLITRAKSIRRESRLAKWIPVEVIYLIANDFCLTSAGFSARC